MQLGHVCNHPHQITRCKGQHQCRSYKPVLGTSLNAKSSSYNLRTDVCCGPLGTKKKEQAISPTTMTRANTTGKPEAMAVVMPVSDEFTTSPKKVTFGSTKGRSRAIRV